MDFLDTSNEELEKEGHTSGAQCKCQVCLKLKLLEDKFILKSGTFYKNGLIRETNCKIRLGRVGNNNSACNLSGHLVRLTLTCYLLCLLLTIYYLFIHYSAATTNCSTVLI